MFREIRLNIDRADIRNSSKVKNIDSKYIMERFAHLTRHRLCVKALLAHLSGPTVAATKLSTRVSHMHQVAAVTAHGTIRTSLSNASGPSCGCHGAIHTNLSDASRLDCACHRTIHMSLSLSVTATGPFAPVSQIREVPAVAATKLFTRISHMHQIAAAAATELFTRVSHIHQVPVVAAT